MTTNEIKKALYKEKPIAVKFAEIIGTGFPEHIVYETKLANNSNLYFKVPLNEMGESIFEEEMPAQLLIRWLIPKVDILLTDEDKQMFLETLITSPEPNEALIKAGKNKIEFDYKQALEVFQKEAQAAFDAPNVHEYMKEHAKAYHKLLPFQLAYDKIKEPKFSQVPKYGDHMPIDEMHEAVVGGMFMDTDGHGNYATESQMSNIIMNFDAVKEQKYPDWVTHVVWFNK